MEFLNEYIKLLLMSLCSILILFVISKLLGKKQIAQLEFIDYIVGISIGSIASEMATDINDKPIQYYIIAMLIFFFVDLLFSLIGRKTPFLKRALKGRPEILIYEGKIDYKIIKKNKIDINDVLALCRQQGFFDLEQIAYAILENSGNISIMPKGKFKPPVISDFKNVFENASLPNYLVIDGYISYSALNNINKDDKWLFEKLNIISEKSPELKNILLVTYNEENDNINIDYKNKEVYSTKNKLDSFN